MTGIFTKRNTTGQSDALICEAEGLESLREALLEAGVSGLRVPELYRVDEAAMEIEAIDCAPGSVTTFDMLGEGLALIHRKARPAYGWARDNYIGLSVQPNRWSDSWGDFFVRDRLGYQVSLIRDSSVRASFGRVLEKHGRDLAFWLDSHCEHPSLIHGDLWSGNVLFDLSNSWLIDPAIYCGDREADLAMTEMFGGFGDAFYDAYDRMYARSAVYGQKRDIYNLYHFLNHYNLFGGSYLGGCERGFAMVKRVLAEQP
ncbi:fructosamine kinase [Marinobacter salinus]|uniref:Fructosamine kinase n=1 Tax=Marinobacter salinus TaxID=1874317 RepID=A0A1D9GJZ3_9GAMM|nr:fructosamine kinase family protein [Marinobacter salinus]AOY87854.1 fructosamine kinase [Marinobacter salinus]